MKWMQSLSARMMLIFILGIISISLVATWLTLRDSDKALLKLSQIQMVDRVINLVTVLDDVPPTQRAQVIQSFQSPGLRIYLTKQPVMLHRGLAQPNPQAQATFDQLFKQNFAGDRAWILTVSPLDFSEAINNQQAWKQLQKMHILNTTQINTLTDTFKPPIPLNGYVMYVQVHLLDGSWVHFKWKVVERGFRYGSNELLILLAMVLLGVLILVMIAVRWVVQPLKTLARAADELGQNINASPLKETGPREVRAAAHAFNSMQKKLQDYLQDKTHFLAAISHDLKTPLTRLRLRAELLEDQDQVLCDKIKQDLAEMEWLLQRALDYMRGVFQDEAPQWVDVTALLDALQADLAEQQKIVMWSSIPLHPLWVKPVAFKRALMNVFDNAIRYGKRAFLLIEETSEGLVLTVYDEGEGVAVQVLGKLTEPFFRADPSRNPRLGGMGLGLSIVDAIVKDHGGNLSFSLEKGRGLVVKMLWPRALS